MRTLSEVDVKDQVVLVRVDYNVPLEEDGSGEKIVASDLRIRASLPTINYLRENGAKKIILISHLGRPKGVEGGLSLGIVAERLAMILAEQNRPGEPLPSVDFVGEIIGDEVRKAVDELPDGGILLLENLRFDSREEENSEDFAREIVADTGATLFVQDGFAVTHREHASTVAIAKLLPAVAGFLVEREVKALRRALNDPEQPFVVIVGGSKVEDKQPLIEKFVGTAKEILVGGKIAADGYVAEDSKIYVAEDFDEDGEGHKLDIGPVATSKFIESLTGAKTVLWNGVLGKVEDPAFATGSEIVAKFLGEDAGIKTIVCGGDTAGFVEELMAENSNLHYELVSTGGGAALELLTGGKMPGIEVLGQ